MLVVEKKKALVMALRNPARVTSVIPSAKIIHAGGRDLVAVKHGLDEAKVLRNLGLDAPSPIRHYYEWSGQYTPFEAQRTTAEFLTLNNRAYLLSGLGSGKSVTTLWAYDYLRRIGKRHKLLIIAPLSTLELTWSGEIFRNFPHLTSVVLHGTRDKRLKLLQEDVDVYIVNHDGVEIIKDALKDRKDIDLVAVDELAQVARNANTARWKALNVVCNKQGQRAVWGITGLPIPNAPTDAWAQCRLVTPESVPPYFNRFRDAVMRQAGPFNWVPRDNALDIVQQAMQPAIRFAREDCVDLPELMYETRQVELTKEQAKAYKDMMSKMRVEAEHGDIIAVNEAVKAGKLVQCATGVMYDANGSEFTIGAQPRIDETVNIIRQSEGKTLVFVPFVSSLRYVAEAISACGISTASIHGGTSKRERDVILREFQHCSDPRVLVAQPATLSHGLSLTSASTIIWYAPITSNDTAQQANGRITRPGQKRPMLIVELTGTPLETRMYRRLRDKQSMQGVLLDEIREASA